MRAAPPMMLTILPCDSLSSGQNSRRQPHRGVEFQREAVGPGVVRLIEKLAAFGGAGIVDQHVATLEALADLRKHLLATGKRAQVAGNVIGSGPPAAATALAPSARLAAFDAASTHLRALARKRHGNGPADAAAAAADDHDFSLEFLRQCCLP